tara:strand:- start:1997 stop:2374 length:378 start_codon:yes stop_codon:yes gene_type:complete
MSTITVTNIKATGETASRAVSGVAAAWVHYNHGTTTINQSNNTSSVTDVANGEAKYTYSSALDAANYCLQASGKTDDNNTDSTGNRVWVRPFGSTATTGSSFVTDSGGTERDCSILCLTTFGDLA